MKTRVIIKNNMYVPQVKSNWFTGWRGINSKFEQDYYLEVQFRDLQEAIHHIEEYKFQEKNNERIVWENEDKD